MLPGILRVLLLTVCLLGELFGNKYMVLSNTSLNTFNMAPKLTNGKSDKIGEKSQLSSRRSNLKMWISRPRNIKHGIEGIAISSENSLGFSGQQAAMGRLLTKTTTTATGTSISSQHSVKTLQFGLKLRFSKDMKRVSDELHLGEAAEKSLRASLEPLQTSKAATSKYRKPQRLHQDGEQLKPIQGLKPLIHQEALPLKYMLKHIRLSRDVKSHPINFSIVDGNDTSVTMNKEKRSATPRTQDMKPSSTSYLQTETLQVTASTLFRTKSFFTNHSTTKSSNKWDALFIGVDYILALYAIVAFVGCLGNIYVLFDALKALRRLHTNEIFLIQLCIINLLILLTLTAMVVFMKIGFHFTCHVVFSLTSVYLYGTVYTLTTISIQQYHAIAFPFKPKPSLRVLVCITVMICVTSVTLSLPVIMFQELLPRPCTSFKMEILYLRRLYYSLTAVLQYILPLVIIAVYYTKLALFLKRSRTEIERHSDADPRQFQSPRKQRDRRVVMVMVTIVITFGICLLPQHVQFFIIEFITNGTLYNGMAIYSYFPILLKACIDTVVYGAIGRKLRSRCCCSKPNPVSIGPRHT